MELDERKQNGNDRRKHKSKKSKDLFREKKIRLPKKGRDKNFFSDENDESKFFRS